MFQVLLIYLFIFVIVFHIIFYHKYHFPHYIREIDKIPGPKGVFYFGNILHFYKMKSEEMLPYMMREFRNWGQTLKFWYSGVAVVVTSDVEDVQTILTSKLSYEKGIMYDNIRPWLGSGLLTSKGEKWRMMRKIITPAFHFSILKNYVQIFSKNSKTMLELLRQSFTLHSVNLNNFITFCALDSICETSMGKSINSQITKCENEYVRAILRIGQVIVERLFSPHYSTNHMFMLSPLGREHANLVKTLHGVTSKLIQERKQQLSSGTPVSESKSIPFLDLLIEKQKTYHFSDTDLREEVDTVLMAGHDTSATALSWCFFEVGYREDIQDKIYQELERIFEGSSRDPTYQDLMEMDYLKRVLQETLRLYPSVPVISKKFHGNLKLKNYMVPANTEVVIVLYCLHRNPEAYPNPEAFDPDRFLSEAMKNRNPFAYVPFSAGARNCIGQKYAMLQMLVLSSYVFRNFKIKTLTKRESVKPVPDVILRPNTQIQWELIPRV